MRRGALAFVVILIMVVGIAGCSSQSASTSSSSGSASSSSSSSAGSSTESSSSTGSGSSTESGTSKQDATSPESILSFDGNENSAKLVADMDAGIMPVKCTVLYDQMGSLPSVTVTDEKTIGEVYDRLAKITVIGESPYSMTDNYHSVSFELQDGTKVGFNFEGEVLLSRGRVNYAIEGSGPLWAYVRSLQAGVTGGKNVYAIDVQDDAGVVVSCPLTAEEGESVSVVCSTESGKKTHVFANGEEVTRSSDIYVTTGGSDVKTPTGQKKYEFIMPASDVELKVIVGS